MCYFGDSTVYLEYLPCIVLKGIFLIVYTVLDVFQGADSTESIPYGYLPTAHTCGSVLVLPIGFLTAPLPEEQGLFQVYDLAFANAHFGTM